VWVTSLQILAEFSKQSDEAYQNFSCDLNEILGLEQSLSDMHKMLDRFIEVTNEHTRSEEQNMEGMKLEWNQMLQFTAKP
jgi:hypothetical protein